MTASLVYLKLELKRAYKKLPHIYGGAIALVCLLGVVAFLATKVLYGDELVGRIEIGVVMPEDDQVAKKVLSMVSSLDSVKSLCDFSYMEKEEALERMKNKELYAVMEIPQGFVQGIMNGSNTPVRILLPSGNGVESRIFQALTEAGARTLSSSQGGIYAGGALCTKYAMESSIGELEKDLNQIYLGYSLPRLDYFRHRQLSGTGGVEPWAFYSCSAIVLLLLLSGISISSYLIPDKQVLKQKLFLLGIPLWVRVLGKILGVASLLLTVLVPIVLVGWVQGWMSHEGEVFLVIALIILSVASVLVLFYQLAGSLMGGVMGLFLLGISQHFLAGGFLPLVFLPKGIQAVGRWMPSAIWLDGMETIVTGIDTITILLPLMILFLISTCISILSEVRA